MVKQGKERVRVTGWKHAGGDGAGLDLFILIDDASDSSLGSQLNDLREFINAQTIDYVGGDRLHAERHRRYRTKLHYRSRSGGKGSEITNGLSRCLRKPLSFRR
jgi:hypothetical protein